MNEDRIAYVREHSKEIHLFGERTDGLEKCIIHGELMPGKKRPKTQFTLDELE